MTAGADETATPTPGAGMQGRIPRMLSVDRLDLIRGLVPFAMLALLLVVSSLVSDVFLSEQNLVNVVRASTVLGFVALGEALVLIAGRFDLSVGATLAAAGTAYLEFQDAGVVIATLAALLVGLFIGAVNGLLVAVIDANSLIVTLGMASVVTGGILIATDAAFLTGEDPSLTYLGRAEWGGIPVAVFLFAAAAVALEVWLRKTPFGRGVFATGANEHAAQASGVRVARVRFICFVACGGLSALGGVVLTSRVNASEATAGVGYEFDAITACLLGGISLFGGQGSMLRAATGVLILAFLSNLLVLMNAPFESQLMVKGIAFVAIVALDGVIRERGRS